MACACKVNQKIDYIHKKYGYDKTKNLKKTKIRQNIKIFLKDIFIWILILPLIPIIFGHIFCVSYFSKEKKINILQLLKIKSYAK